MVFCYSNLSMNSDTLCVFSYLLSFCLLDLIYILLILQGESQNIFFYANVFYAFRQNCHIQITGRIYWWSLKVSSLSSCPAIPSISQHSVEVRRGGLVVSQSPDWITAGTPWSHAPSSRPELGWGLLLPGYLSGALLSLISFLPCANLRI